MAGISADTAGGIPFLRSGAKIPQPQWTIPSFSLIFGNGDSGGGLVVVVVVVVWLL